MIDLVSMVRRLVHCNTW